MLSAVTESFLARFFVEVAQSERSIEIQRQIVCENPDFQPHTAFARITRNVRIDSLDLTLFLRENGLYASEREVYHALRCWDTTRDGSLSMEDFLDVVLPATRPSLAQIARERIPGRSSLRMPHDVEFALASLMFKEIQAYSKVEELRQSMAFRRDFNLIDAFETLDRFRDGFITESALRIFLNRHGHLVADQDILAIMRRLDHDQDGRLSFTQASQAFQCAQRCERPRSHGVWDRVRACSRSQSAPRRPREISASPIRSRRPIASPKRYHSPVRQQTARLNRSFHTPTRLGYHYFEVRDKTPPRSLHESYVMKTPPRPRRIDAPRILTRSPLRIYDEQELALALKSQIDLDKELEKAKEDIALRSDFNTVDAFNIFDPVRKGHIVLYDLKELYNLCGQYPSHEELQLLLERYDSDYDRKWSYPQFVEAILPKNRDYAAIARGHIPFNTTGRYGRLTLFTAETSFLFKKLLRAWIECEIHSERVRRRITNISVWEAFTALDKYHKGYLTEIEVRLLNNNQFRDLLELHRFYASREDLKLLVDRYDQNKDGRVSLGEFEHEIRPKSPCRR